MIRICAFFASLFLLHVAFGQSSLEYYFGNQSFDSEIPTPASVLGYEIGDRHVSHDQMIYYLDKLVASSDRMIWKEYGRSYEQRPLVQLYVSSPANLARLDEIKTNKLKLSDKDQVKNLSTTDPVVIYQGYSVHGNEASGGNAALLFAYYLAAAQSSELKKQLDDVVIILDPCYNPDGFNRFASWVNTHRAEQLSSDRANREFSEAWPGGRTNHYWFDLNRDWLLLQHPESRGRIKTFQEWKPVVLTDHHEMGTDRSFFFQPGIPSRTYPRTPQMNQDLTKEIGRYHEAILDSVKSLYYTEESFDDYYIGKGSTYPDVQGCIGILFEQASSRGHRQESKYGIKDFPFTVKNQLLTSFSTLRASHEMRDQLKAYQKDFYVSALREAAGIGHSGWQVESKGDQQLFDEFCEILDQHHIAYDRSRSGRSAYVPTTQPQHRLIEAIFEERTEFVDSLFYDVSAWTLPHAYNLDYRKASKPVKTSSAVELTSQELTRSDYAYLIDNSSSQFYPMVLDLMEQGIRLLVTHREYTSVSNGRTYPRGMALLSLEDQPMDDEMIYDLLVASAKMYGVNVHALDGGGKSAGVNPGSPAHDVLSAPSVALIVGPGVRSYDAGEIWHLFDQRLHYPITLISTDLLRRADWDRYNTIIMADGNYPAEFKSILEDWASSDRKIIALRGANSWLKSNGVIDIDLHRSWSSSGNGHDRPYDRRSADQGSRIIGGSLFMTELDLTHPLNYGYGDDQLPIFKRSTMYLADSDNVYATPSHFIGSPLLSGYSPSGYAEHLAGKASLITTRYKGARVICFTENPAFRAYFRGTQRQLCNAILWGEHLHGSTLE